MLALKLAPRKAILQIETKSEQAYKYLVKETQILENTGYLNIPNASLLRAITSRIRRRKGRTSIKLLGKGAKPSQRAEPLAEGAIRMERIRTDSESEKVPGQWSLTGAKLKTLTQSTAYQHIRAIKLKKYKKRRATKEIINKVKREMGRLGTHMAERDIWKGIRNKDIARTARYFMWMTL
ncbi:hypothetical protein CPC08DRAFT_77232, partial [Agrocybe pediades]